MHMGIPYLATRNFTHHTQVWQFTLFKWAFMGQINAKLNPSPANRTTKQLAHFPDFMLDLLIKNIRWYHQDNITTDNLHLHCLPITSTQKPSVTYLTQCNSHQTITYKLSLIVSKFGRGARQYQLSLTHSDPYNQLRWSTFLLHGVTLLGRSSIMRSFLV